MRALVAIALVSAAVLGLSAGAQSGRHLNPMVDLIASKK